MGQTRLNFFTISICLLCALGVTLQGCGKGAPSSSSGTSSTVESAFQRESHVTAGPVTEPLLAEVKSDWAKFGAVSETENLNLTNVSPLSTARTRYWDNQLNQDMKVPKSAAVQPSNLIKSPGAREGANAKNEILTPARNFTTIWVHVFPVLNTRKAIADFPRKMPNDPYGATKDSGTVRISALSGVKIARLKDGLVIAEGNDLAFRIDSITKKEMLTVDLRDYPLEDVFISPLTDMPTTMTFDKNSSFSFRGGFVVSREITPAGKPCLRVVNVVSVEDYLKAVVPAEMPAAYPIEALKAQSVAARTYALYRTLFNRCDLDHRTKKCRKESPNAFDVFANTQDQLYIGVAKENDRTSSAVDKTTGVVATYNGEVIQAFFHANSGGRTCSYRDCYGGINVPYLQSVGEPDPAAVRDISGGRNVQKVSTKSFAHALKGCGVAVTPSDEFKVIFTKHNSSDRVIEAEVKTDKEAVTLSAENVKCVRQWLGVPSAYFENTLSNTNGNLTVTSLGFGHGVGLSQEGAHVQATHGQGYENILKLYYHNVKVINLKTMQL